MWGGVGSGNLGGTYFSTQLKMCKSTVEHSLKLNRYLVFVSGNNAVLHHSYVAAFQKGWRTEHFADHIVLERFSGVSRKLTLSSCLEL